VLFRGQVFAARVPVQPGPPTGLRANARHPRQHAAPIRVAAIAAAPVVAAVPSGGRAAGSLPTAATIGGAAAAVAAVLATIVCAPTPYSDSPSTAARSACADVSAGP
jgi:hypothetical protein